MPLFWQIQPRLPLRWVRLKESSGPGEGRDGQKAEKAEEVSKLLVSISGLLFNCRHGGSKATSCSPRCPRRCNSGLIPRHPTQPRQDRVEARKEASGDLFKHALEADWHPDPSSSTSPRMRSWLVWSGLPDPAIYVTSGACSRVCDA